MKKALLFASLTVAGFSFGQCTDLFISEYVEGSGNDKALELYNPTGNTIDLSGYRIERFSNGQATSSSGGVTNLSGTVAPYSTFVIVNGQTTSTPSSPAASPALQAMADQLDGAYPAPTYMNGNDAIVLYKNTAIIDIFGKTGDASMTSAYGWSDAFPYDGSAGAIWTENQTLVRKPSVLTGVTTNPTYFIVTQEWDSLPNNTWTGLGSHTCNCELAVQDLNTVAMQVYPNPSNGVAFVSAAQNIQSVTLVSMTGEVVMEVANTAVSQTVKLNTEGLKKGVYVVKVNFGDAFSASTSSLIIQ